MRKSWLLLLFIFGLVQSELQAIKLTCDSFWEFDCGTGPLGCISIDWKCDGIKDCRNGADEIECDNDGGEGELLCSESVSINKTCNLTEEFDCGTGNLGCIPKSWQCDNIKDCHNGADEIDCEPNECQDGELRCGNGRCVKGTYKCDGYEDCYDKTDEKHCECNSRRPNVPALFNFGDPNQYNKDKGHDENGLPGYGFCASRALCIPNRLFCDGHENCLPDFEDERNCTQKALVNAVRNPCKDKFVCKTRNNWDRQVCIRMEEVCNGKKECPHGDDESEMCDECSTKHCEYQCRNTPNGAKCLCKSGYRLDSDGVSCVDLDECTLPERACHHFCENQIGSFVCSCAKGYHLEEDGKSCVLTNPSKGTLLLSFYDGIRERPLEDFSETNFTTVPINQVLTNGASMNGNIQSFDYLPRDKKLFMVISAQNYNRFVVEENGKSETIRENVTASMNLAVDWIGGNLFFTEEERTSSRTGRISVCTMDGKFCRKLIGGIDSPGKQLLAIHPIRGLFFFVDSQNHTYSIMMAHMDGSQIEPLVKCVPTVLAIDYANHDLYFGDFYNNIQRVNIDTKKTVLIASNAFYISTMVFHNGFLYWTEGQGMVAPLRVLEVARNGARVHSILENVPFIGPFYHMVVNDKLHQLEPTNGNPCKEIDCPWICVIVPNFTAKCLCPDGYTLSAHDSTCTPSFKENGKQENGS